MKPIGAHKNLGGWFIYIRLFGYQLDYRQNGWLPPSVRILGNPDNWRVLQLGRFGCVTFGALRRMP